MNNLVIDMTHGGVKIAISLAKKRETVYAYDIYNTLKNIDKKMLEIYNVKIIDLEYLKNLTGNIKVIYPVHLPLTKNDIKKYNQNLNYTFLTHHEIIKELLKDWGKNIPKIEITGVKGKTSCVFMLKEILINENPLILSSLGALLYEKGNEKVLKQNISITPANIKETIDLAYKISNPICDIANGNCESQNIKKYNCAIFETSLGASGIGDVGLLTNITENYTIAKNKSNAAIAKSQIFNCNTVVIQKETLDNYYTNIKHKKLNTFSLDNKNANLTVKNVIYDLDKTKVQVTYNNIITTNNKVISGELEINTFAPGKHHVKNVLGVITTCLSLNIPKNQIINGLKNYKGIKGRTNKKIIENSIIIEEINPGINTKTIEESINMLKDLENYYIAIGGDYGITCEEIDEYKVSNYLNNIKQDIILTGDVGAGILKKMNKKVKYSKDFKNIYQQAIHNNKNLLLIYRSDYRKLNER
ncbi:coenzyme F430 synthase [uncultured Methanobrevibacter sp.]|uniref:coenzyme F430 synthase n=1 Tax=uncultured Methanobrevibacter sp. TaxID=253161 RepID=UPI002622E336|nr:coenzyme F430 synthase [uncultured Methanobrevibacter sp.]